MARCQVKRLHPLTASSAIATGTWHLVVVKVEAFSFCWKLSFCCWIWLVSVNWGPCVQKIWGVWGRAPCWDWSSWRSDWCSPLCIWVVPSTSLPIHSINCAFGVCLGFLDGISRIRSHAFQEVYSMCHVSQSCGILSFHPRCCGFGSSSESPWQHHCSQPQCPDLCAGQCCGCGGDDGPGQQGIGWPWGWSEWIFILQLLVVGEGPKTNCLIQHNKSFQKWGMSPRHIQHMTMDAFYEWYIMWCNGADIAESDRCKQRRFVYIYEERWQSVVQMRHTSQHARLVVILWRDKKGWNIFVLQFRICGYPTPFKPIGILCMFLLVYIGGWQCSCEWGVTHDGLHT